MYNLDLLNNIEFDQELSERIKSYTEISKCYDEFEETNTIKFNKIGIKTFGGSNKNFFLFYRLSENYVSEFDYLGITFINHNGFSYMQFVTNNEVINLVNGDYLIILFEDKSKLELKFTRPKFGNYFKNNIIPLDGNDLFLFLTKKIDKIKVVSIRKNIYDIYGFNDGTESKYGYFQYQTKLEGQALFKYAVYLFIKFNLDNKI